VAAAASAAPLPPGVTAPIPATDLPEGFPWDFVPPDGTVVDSATSSGLAIVKFTTPSSPEEVQADAEAAIAGAGMTGSCTTGSMAIVCIGHAGAMSAEVDVISGAGSTTVVVGIEQ
jgi:hypothetical protein